MCEEHGEDRDDVYGIFFLLHANCAGFRNTEQLVNFGANRSSWQCDICKSPVKDDVKTVIIEVRSLKATVDSIK